MKPKLVQFLNAALLSVIATSIMISCEKEDDQFKKFPSTLEEITNSVNNTVRIAKESAEIVESSISGAVLNNDNVDPDEIAKRIRLIEGVVSAEPNPSGTGIIIKHLDSTCNNLVIVAADDERMFIETASKSTQTVDQSDIVNLPIPFSPNGTRKALILAPFQSSFNTDLNSIQSDLISAGYMPVDTYLDTEANLNRFRGSFMSDYDIVIIITHGLAHTVIIDQSISSTILSTGVKFNDQQLSQLPLSDRRKIALITVGTETYFAISVPWLEATTDKEFTNSWIFADACESATIDEGPSSLSEAFLKLGAGGYNGFDASIMVSVANSTLKAMTTNFTSGLSFANASDKVRKNLLLITKSWVLRKVRSALGYDTNPELDVRQFDDNQIRTDPFYLVLSGCTDYDGNVYKAITIGTQTWMAENLKTTKYNDGSGIPNLTNTTQWRSTTSGAYCWYNNNETAYKDTYGALYNWYAVNSGKLCPTGWHVPSDAEWKQLEMHLGMSQATADQTEWRGAPVGGMLKETDITHWQSPNTGATNETGFTGLPAGIRWNISSDFSGVRGGGVFWTSTPNNSTTAWFRGLYWDRSTICRGEDPNWYGFSVRCIKD